MRVLTRIQSFFKVFVFTILQDKVFDYPVLLMR